MHIYVHNETIDKTPIRHAFKYNLTAVSERNAHICPQRNN